jgi:acyl-CoA synthetase (AMP-forming)/AMP-acid ligase II
VSPDTIKLKVDPINPEQSHSAMQPREANSSTLVELLQYRVQVQPDQIAYTFLKDDETKSNSITYQELDRQARAIAAKLGQVHLNGSRALMVYSYSAGLEFITAFFGCLYAGVVAVPCHQPRNSYGFNDLQTRLVSAQATAVLTTKALLTELKRRFTIPPDPCFDQLLWLTTDDVSLAQTFEWVQPALDSDTLAFLQYTSGSTGTPKGVMITHECILYNQQMLAIAFGHTQQTIVAGWLPLFHDMGLIGNVIQPLYLGVPCILMSPIAFIQKPFRWLRAISTHQATTSGGPNFAYDLLCRQITAEQKASLDLSHWEVAFSGAETVRAETIDRFVATFESCGFRREAFYPCYGMAESTLFIAGGQKMVAPVIQWIESAALEENQVVVAKSQSQTGRAIVGCGQAWLDEKIVIADSESRVQCPDRQVGEIWVSSPGVGKGYWQQPEETARTFQAYLKDLEKDSEKDSDAGPFLRTGDLGFLQNGELFITGRLKDIMVFWGFNHYPQHIEQTVEACHPALRSNCGAAFSVTIEGEERLVIAQEIERSYRQCLVIDEVVEAIRWAIFQQHFIDVYAIALLKTGSISKTSSGKIQRRLCRDRFLNRELELMGEWRSTQDEYSITTLVTRYLNPLTHAQRYSAFARGRLRRFVYLFWKNLFGKNLKTISR